jgi:hypothetical protein
LTTPEYIKELERQKNLAVNRFGQLTQVEKDVINSSFDWLAKHLDIKAGDIVVTADLSKRMADFVNAVIDIINSNTNYQDKLANYLTDLHTIKNNLAAFQKDVNKIDVDKAGLKNVQKVLIEETIDRYTENGLNAGFAQPLKDGILRNVLGGMSLREAKVYLTDYIASGKDETGKLGSYLEQTAIQIADSYEGALNTKLANTFTFTGYIISGSLIATSSPQCREAIEKSKNGYLTMNEWKQLLNKYKDSLIEGTTVDNLPISKLHWGCRVITVLRQSSGIKC